MVAAQITGAEVSTIVVAYPVSPEEIEAKRAEYAALTFDTPKAYAAGMQALAQCRSTRTQIEDRRKYLKADSLAYGRRVDSVAKELVALVESIEEPLRLKRAAADEAKARAMAEKEAEERRVLEEKLRAEREAEEARLRAEREAEEARLAVERERLAAERAELAEQRRREDEARAVEEARLLAERRAQDAALRAERHKLEAERRQLEEERERAELERRARLKAESDRAAAEDARVAELERQAERERRIAELQPDLVKLAAFAGALRAITGPSCASDAAKAQVTAALGRIARAADGLEAFVAQGDRS